MKENVNVAPAETETGVDTARAIMRRVGIVLIIVGLADIVDMIVSILHHESYSSSLNIFAVILGVLLLRGSLRPVRAVRWFAGFAGGGLLGALIYEMVTTPASLILTEIRLHDFQSVVDRIMSLVFTILALWVYRSLSDPSVYALFDQFGARRWWDRPLLSFSVGMGLGVIVFGLLVFDRPNIDIAMTAAKHRYGPRYEYAMTGYNRQGEALWVGIAAYQPTVIHRMDVLVVHRSVKQVVNAP